MLALMALQVVACAEPVRALDELKALFETDPATAFDEAARMFEAPKARGDLKGMMEVFRVAIEPARSTGYGAVAEDMIDAGLALAEPAGQWALVAELRGARYDLTRGNWLHINSYHHYPAPLNLRQVRQGAAAIEAYQRAGIAVPGGIATDGALRDTPRYIDEARAWARSNLPTVWGAEAAGLAEEVTEAVGDARDADALALLEEMLGMVSGDASDRKCHGIGQFVSSLVWLRGGESLVPGLRAIVETETDPMRPYSLHVNLLFGCTAGWSGRQDAHKNAIDWVWPRIARSKRGDYNALSRLARKMVEFGLATEASGLLRTVFQMTFHLPTWTHRSYLSDAMHPSLPPDLRQTMLSEVLTEKLRTMRTNTARVAGPAKWATLFWNWIILADPPNGREWWGQWMAQEMVKTAHELGKLEDRAFVMGEAADLFALAGRADASEECRALAKSIAESDPKATLLCALASARSRAAERKWEDVAKALEEPAGKLDGTVETLQAALLLHEAYLRTGKLAEAERWMQKAWELVNQVQMSPAEKANYLLSMANLCEVAVQMANAEAGG